MNIENMIAQATGQNTQGLEQAAEQHIASMGADELRGHLQGAATTATANGQSDVAQEIEGMIARKQADPAALKDAAVEYIKSNPQVLTHFAPSFAQGILNRII